MEDLASYEPAIREPVKGTCRGYQIVSNVIDHGMSMQDAIDCARIYERGNADGICWETGGENPVTADVIAELEARDALLYVFEGCSRHKKRTHLAVRPFPIFNPLGSRNYRYFCIPSVAAAVSALMVTVNLMSFFSPNVSSQFRKASVSLSTSRPTVLQRLSTNTWEMS